MKRRAGKRARCAVGVLLIALIACGCAFALDPNLDVSQYAHTVWKVRDGFARGEITSIAQTPDGFIWVGTEFGLLRFDGVRTITWQPPGNQHLPLGSVYSLIASRNGTLWIGTTTGLASWADGKLIRYPELDGEIVFPLLEDHEGTIWVGAGGSPTAGKLCAIRTGFVDCFGGDGGLGPGVLALLEDRNGNLWVGVKGGLWRWKPGPPKFYSLPGAPNGIQALAEDSDGALLIGWKGGIFRFLNGKVEPYPVPRVLRQFRARKIFRDGNGAIWIGTAELGLVHIHQGRADTFSAGDGLSGDFVSCIFEDREGNIWISGIEGLDRFRDLVVITITRKQGLSTAVTGSILSDKDGSVWLATYDGLNLWDQGQVATPPTGAAKREGKLNGSVPNSLFQDHRGRVWVSTSRELGYLENGKFIPVKGVPGGFMLSIAQDTAGNLWVINEHVGLFRISPRNVVLKIPWSSLGHEDNASVLTADRKDGGLLIGFYKGGIAYFADGQVRASFTAANGLGAGRVSDFLFDSEHTLWISTEGGLSRLKNNRVATLTSRNGLPCDTVHWAIEDDDHSMWLYTACGLLRIVRSELEGWSAAADKQNEAARRIQVTVFDSSDGVRSLATPGHYHPQVAKTPDGKLWFLPWDGVSVVDPAHLPFNKLPPPVHIEQIIADHKTYDATPDSNGQVPLPARIRDLQIDYTALSFVAPEKVLFRYKLEGWDRDWQDAGTHRQAFYSNLPPRNYRFRVVACNNSGVWNEAGTSVDFFVAPAYYQTWWFRSACVAAFLGLLTAAHRLRLHQVEQQFNLRLEGGVAERTRIARDLHDTLLQSFQAVLLKFHAVTYMLGDRPDAQKELADVIDQARQAITEGRDAVQGLRAPGLVGNDIAQALSVLGKELANNQNGTPRPDFQVQVEGTPRDLSPLLRDDIYRIACEALSNAFKHAHAGRVEVEIRYDQRELRLRVRDNGKGIDPKVLHAGGRVGHYGFPGMRERAKLVGGKLAVWSEIDSGTEAELSVPASVVYAKPKSARRPTFWAKGARPQ
jgi:signal transduction histidine kinase/ligand-binding sensor domain-containing protein